MSQCHSTNEEAAKSIKSNQFQLGDIHIAEEQLAGKGQRGNKWTSEKGKNLTFSVIWNGSYFKTNPPFGFTMAVSLAVIKALDLPEVKIKWPNDIYHQKSKLGGILIENLFQADGKVITVIGIGLNVNQVSFDRLNAISLVTITQQQSDLDVLLQKLGASLERELLRLPLVAVEKLRAEYESYLYLKDQWANFSSNELQFVGKIKSVNDSGKLQIELENKEISEFDKHEIKLCGVA